ncbi:Uma2 family endonuclease [Streptomyces sp. A 4/2]|uniref:Uma2 family endonuclease n=1 Tax=Streptomyces sp. A 4/2 TaxID=2934314 RepID=UPI00202474EB|nr:Uma2 family endonuclease [Streptomyces sp. A 4/2]
MAGRTEHTSQMTVDEFERIAELVDRESDAVRLEFIDGRIGVRGMTDGNHSEIVRWLQKRCMQLRPELGLYAGDLGLKVDSYRNGRARPAGSLARIGNFAGQGEWAEPDGVLMTVEITSYDSDSDSDSDTDRRDRKEKPAAYAGAGIPLYLLIDRDACTVTVFSDPDPASGRYRDKHGVDFGAKLKLPDPVGIDLDTEELKSYIR